MSTFFEKAVNHLYTHQILWSFLAVLAISIIDVCHYFFTDGQLFYIDTDCYTRAIRIVDWLNDFKWHEKIYPYSNIPYGFALHFTRINDIIWVILSLPFMLFEPLKDAVFHGGMLFSPLFFFLSLTALFWGIKPYIGKLKKNSASFALVFVTTLLFCYRSLNIFDFCYPDHHSVMFCIFCFNIATILRFIDNNKENYFLPAGLTCGLGLWFSSAIEGMLVTSVVLAILGFNWLYGTLKSKHLILFSCGLFVSVTLAWLINPPYGGYGDLDISRLSIIHVVLTALMLLTLISLAKADNISTTLKIMCLCGCGIIVLLLLFMIFGAALLLKPLYSEEIHAIYLPYVADLKSIFHTSYLYYYNYIFSWVAGLLILGFLFYSKFSKTCVLNLALLVLLTLPLGFTALRLYPYYLCVFLYLNGIIIFLLMHLSQKNMKYGFAVLTYLLLIVFFQASFKSDIHAIPTPDFNNDVDNLATDYKLSVHLTWKQGIKTLSYPYHTDEEGLIDNHRLFFTTDENEIKQLLQKHRINYVYLPQTEFNNGKVSYRSDYYIEPEKNIDKFYGKIMTGKNIYNWLEAVPSDLKNGTVYKVRFELF